MISLKNVSKTYSNKEKKFVKALQKTNIEFSENGLIFITGKSGSGKSTLLSIIGLLRKPTTGTVLYGGKETDDFVSDYQNQLISYVFQDYNLIDGLTVEENVLFAGNLCGIEANRDNVNQILSSVGLKNYNHRLLSELSGGEKQRVAVARSLYRNTKILLCDEPTESLDYDNKRKLYDILKEVSKTKLVVVVSHENTMVEEYADRHIHLEDGGVVFDDSIQSEVDGDCSLIKRVRKISDFFYILKTQMKITKINILFRVVILSLSLLLVNYIAIEFQPIKRNVTRLLNLNSEQYIAISHDDENDYYYSNLELDSFYDKESMFKIYDFDTPILVDYANTELSYKEKVYYRNCINGMVEIDENLVEKTGVELIKGEFPEIKEDYSEVAISLYTANHYLLLEGYNSLGELIGKTITIDGIPFVITGIINTHDMKKYEDILGEMNFLDVMEREKHLINHLNNSLASMVFVPSKFISENNPKWNDSKMDIVIGSNDTHDGFDGFLKHRFDGLESVSIERSLSKNEVLIPFDSSIQSNVIPYEIKIKIVTPKDSFVRMLQVVGTYESEEVENHIIVSNELYNEINQQFYTKVRSVIISNYEKDINLIYSNNSKVNSDYISVYENEKRVVPISKPYNLYVSVALFAVCLMTILYDFTIYTIKVEKLNNLLRCFGFSKREFVMKDLLDQVLISTVALTISTVIFVSVVKEHSTNLFEKTGLNLSLLDLKHHLIVTISYLLIQCFIITMYQFAHHTKKEQGDYL